MPIEARRFPPESFLHDAAHFLAAENRKADLSGITVLLPNLHAASEFAIEIRKAAGFPFVLLPQMETLSGFACPEEFVPESLRGARLYLALREKGWFGENDLWHLSSELSGLFEELTRWKVSLHRNGEEFSSMLEKAYKSGNSESLRFEAMLIHELWYAMELDGSSKAAASQLKLASLATNPSGPLYVLAPDELTRAEQAFLASWAEKAPVRVFSEERSGFYSCLWPEKKDRNIMQRAEDCSFAPLSNIRLFCARDLEEEAESAQIRIRQWLMAGKKSIALVALDRLAARRTRALLERAEILVSDETGWTLSTTSASTVIIRLLDAIASDFYHEDMLDLLKSPFIFTDWPAESRQEAVHALEQAIRKHHVVSGLDHYERLVLETESKAAMDALRFARQRFSAKTMTLSGWLDALSECLVRLGISPGLEADLAGEALLEGLSELRNELSNEKGRFGFRSWRRWLDMRLESMTFRDSSIRSPVVFTHLHATRLRKFDAVVLLGCDAMHLPSESAKSPFFNQAVRAELGLPLKETERLRQLENLSGLLSRAGEIWASWQFMKKGEPNLMSPFLEELNAFHVHAFGIDLVERDFSGFMPMMRLEKRRQKIGPTFPPSPSVVEGLVPGSISASGYNSLLACPYQYYASRILKLSAIEEAEKIMEKADYGSHLHRILHRFHTLHPEIADVDEARIELERISDSVFREAVEADYLSNGWALRWKKMIPEYLEWQKAREAEGWRIDSMEEERQLQVELDQGRRLILKGRIDRVDVSKEGVSVIDYKTQIAAQLREKLKEPGEDVQLEVYALLLDEPVKEAAFLSLDGKVEKVPCAELRVEENRDRLASIFEEICGGAGLPAQGIARVCANCEMRGLCRKDYWQ